mmetsp:Transcript_31439/g.91911  ORF Transcript_31439/g.91911 Transcript_31439/m.91911 type:complete len:82 (-) Transcript_31439:1182-1427(-)
MQAPRAPVRPVWDPPPSEVEHHAKLVRGLIIGDGIGVFAFDDAFEDDRSTASFHRSCTTEATIERPIAETKTMQTMPGGMW